MEFVNNSDEVKKVQVRVMNDISWKTLKKGDKVVAYDRVYAEAYSAQGLEEVKVESVPVEKVVKKRVSRNSKLKKK